MSLIEEMRKGLSEAEWYGDVAELADDLNTRLDEIVDQPRWGVDTRRVVVEKNGEYAMLTWEQSSGDGDYVGEPDLKEVVPVEKTVVDYVSIDSALAVSK